MKNSDLSPKKLEKLQKLRKTLISTGRTKERAQVRVRMLKKVVLEYEFKMMRISENNVDKLIGKHEKISPNEKVAIKEIFKAADTKDLRGRRYSPEWIIFSLLLHMRSPVIECYMPIKYCLCLMCEQLGGNFSKYKLKFMLHWKKMFSKTYFFELQKYATAILLVSTTTFFVGVTIWIVVTRTWVVTPTKKVVVLTNKISVEYFTNRSSWLN